MKKVLKQYRQILKCMILFVLLCAVLFLLNTNFSFLGRKSIHEDARTYRTRHCLVFYPDSKTGYSEAKNLCKGVKDDRIFDYTLIPFGDYYMVSYGRDLKYFTDKQYQLLQIEDLSDEGKKIAADYLRYEIKKQRPEDYYNAEYLSTLRADQLDFTGVTYEISEENLICRFPEYDLDVSVPLRYLQKALNMNFGYPQELYRKPVYLDPSEDHPIICLTFDDGPYFWSEKKSTPSEAIVDLLYQYDASATFYVVGYNLENRDIWADYQAYMFLRNSINQGNEYGSHTQNHPSSLKDLSTYDEIYDEINGPIRYMEKFMDYEMKTYRPVGGEFDEDVLSAQPLPAILWDVDSEDWYSRDVQTICDRVLSYEYESGDIVLFHDIYFETAEALEKIVPELINRGCQLVSVSDMLTYYGIDPSSISYFFSPGYYE
ncbi:MAG: polysaccharide deacetylase family protein [Erysipelotrichaceae bacterium]|nr:polysaccharide deacetylase family protein [Erysipelotrichaceae bacterium]